MPSKTEEYLALAQRTANGLTRYWESWTDYLTTASRLYKYPFADQLMIYAQRPDATACAEFDIWRNRMNRYVRRGSKGIALLDESSGFPRLHYVFDVSDTGVRRNSRDPEVWQYLPAAAGGSTLAAALNFLQQGGIHIAGRSHPENHCPVHENGQTHRPSVASCAEKIFAAPGQGAKAAPRQAKPETAESPWCGPDQH